MFEQAFFRPDSARRSLSEADHVCAPVENPNSPIELCAACGVFIAPNYFRTGGASRMVRSAGFTRSTSDSFISRAAFDDLVHSEPKHPTFEPAFQGFGQRSRILENLRRIANHYGFSPSTYYLAIHYVDVVLSKASIPDEFTHPFTYCCCLIAAKVTEPQVDIPLLESAVTFFQHTLSAQMIKDMENYILVHLCYKLLAHTPFSVAATFLGFGVVNAAELPPDVTDREAFLASVERTALEFVDAVSCRYAFNQFRPAVQAFAAIACARKVHGLSFWSPDLARLSQTRWATLQPPTEMFLEVVHEIDPEKTHFFADFFGPLDEFGARADPRFPDDSTGSWIKTAPSKASVFCDSPLGGCDRENIDNQSRVSVLESTDKRYSTQPSKRVPFGKGAKGGFSSIANTLGGRAKGGREEPRGGQFCFSSQRMRI